MVKLCLPVFRFYQRFFFPLWLSFMQLGPKGAKCISNFHNHLQILHVMDTLSYYSLSRSAANTVVTPLHKAASYEPRIAIFGIWGNTWLTRGKYCIYLAVRGSYGVYVTPSGKFCNVKSALFTVVSPTWR